MKKYITYYNSKIVLDEKLEIKWIKDQLSQYERNGYTHVDYDMDNIGIGEYEPVWFPSRLETNEEYKKRLKKEDPDYQTYLKLKERFEK